MVRVDGGGRVYVDFYKVLSSGENISNWRFGRKIRESLFLFFCFLFFFVFFVFCFLFFVFFFVFCFFVFCFLFFVFCFLFFVFCF